MNLKNTLLATGAAALVWATAGSVIAQDAPPPGPRGGGRGNFDPAQFQQRMMENIREEMGVTNNEEWVVIQARVQKVMDARRDVAPGGFGRMMRPRRNQDNNGDNGPGGRRGMFGGTPMPEMEALNSAIESKVPAEQLKSTMDKYRVARKAKELALEKAQLDLKSILTVKQEAVALSLGLVD
jgi:hypothetical protein